MPRKKKWPPPVYLHKPSGQARVRIDGRDHYLGPYGSEAADRAFADLLLRYRSGPPSEQVRTGSLTVAEVCARWTAEVAPTVGERGRERQAFARALTVVIRTCGPEPAAGFDVAALERVREAMVSGSWRSPAERKEHGRRYQTTWCRNVVNRMIVRVKTVWRWAERKKLVPPGSWEHLRTLRALDATDRTARRTQPVRPVEWEELERVIEQVRRAEVRAMLLLQWYTGMRSGEVRLMRVGDVDASNETWTYRPVRHKNDWRGEGHERVVPLGPEARKVIAPWLARRQPVDWVFPSPRRPGQPYTSMTYAQAARRAGQRAGVPGFHPYRLRHSAKRRITRELGLDAARAVLGQKSVETTARYASEADLKAATEAARKCG